MLVDLTPNFEEIERRTQVAIEHNFLDLYVPQYHKQWKQGVGVYQCNFPHHFSYDEFMEFKDMPCFSYDQSFGFLGGKKVYSVADNLEQILRFYKKEIEDPDNKYVITLTPVFQEKENRGKGGGWRWHKWGKYIGKLKRKCEYLDDEDFGDDFKYVICFHIYKVR